MQILYADEFCRRNGETWQDSSESVLAGADEDVKAYALYLSAGVREKRQELDEIISGYSQKRTIDEIDIVDLSVLRLAVFSLLYDNGVQPKIIIDEAVKLSLEFSNELNYRFINGVLDAYVKNTFPAESIKSEG